LAKAEADSATASVAAVASDLIGFIVAAAGLIAGRA